MKTSALKLLASRSNALKLAVTKSVIGRHHALKTPACDNSALRDTYFSIDSLWLIEFLSEIPGIIRGLSDMRGLDVSGSMRWEVTSKFIVNFGSLS